MKSTRDYTDPPTSHHGDPVSTTIITSTATRIITRDDAGYHITNLGDEIASVDPSTGEVCRKRPAVSRIDIPSLRPGILAAILADTLKNCAGPSRNVEMARTLLNRTAAHIDEIEDRADKLAAKGQVEQ